MNKRHLILAIVLIAVLVVLVSCSAIEDGMTVPKKFSENMSVEQICGIIKNLKNVTSTEYYKEEDIHAVIKYSDDFASFTSGNYSITSFFEDGREYSYHVSEDGETNYYITDFSGYRTKQLKFDDYSVFKNELIEALKGGHEYKIANGKLIVEDLNGRDIELKDCNYTKFSVPSGFENYKSLEANEEPVQFSLSYGGTRYSIDYIDSLLYSYEFPETYNGLPVDYSMFTYWKVSNLDEVTLPTTIEYLDGELVEDYRPDDTLHIIFKGTKAQWANIGKTDCWLTTNGNRVTCIDGEYSDTDDVKFNFTKDMSKEEICDAINNLESFTMMLGSQILRVGKNFVYAENDALMLYYEQKTYVIDSKFNIVELIDYTGYDADVCKYTKRYMDFYKDMAISQINNGSKYTVSKGNLVISGGEGLMIKDANSTTIDDLNGKMLEWLDATPTRKAVEYELSEDKTYYTISSMGQCLVNYGVPTTYNGLPVRVNYIDDMDYLNELTIDASVTQLGGTIESGRSSELHIIFKGTQEQWDSIEKSEAWTEKNNVRVTCNG